MSPDFSHPAYPKMSSQSMLIEVHTLKPHLDSIELFNNISTIRLV